MSSTSNQLSFTHRFKQVYVDVPPYPSHASGYTPLRSHTNSSLQMSDSLPHKRKTSDHDMSVATNNTAKRPKLSIDRSPLETRLSRSCASATTLITPLSNASADFPNGFVYCHQCSKKRDAATSIQCTSLEYHSTTKAKTTKERRCPAKFCTPCLKNRYGEDIDKIRGKGSSYIFECPKCRDICNCARCRNSKGLEPTGNLTHAARKVGAESVAQILGQDPEVKGIMPGKGAQTEKPKSRAILADNFIDSTLSKEKDRIPKKLKKEVHTKPLPMLSWTSLPINLNLKDAEERIQIREFIHRFASLMEPTISKTHLKELDEIGGRRGTEDDEMCMWVSDACVKAILLGLLGLLANSQNRRTQEAVILAIKDVRSSGASLTKIWTILSSLRNYIADLGSSSEDPILTFPDPLPPPESATPPTVRKMRSNRDAPQSFNVIQVLHSAQMIPVLVALINATLETREIREDIDNGVKDGKEMVRIAKDGGKQERDVWGKEKKELATMTLKKNKMEVSKQQTQKTAHRQRIEDLDNALKVVMPGFAPRFAPLGSDSDGRIYWAVPPSATERETARDSITSITEGKGGDDDIDRYSKSKRRIWYTEEERCTMREWSWFVAVYGKKPSSESPILKTGKGRAQDGDESDLDVDGGEDGDRWWGFWEPTEIRKVAEWISIKAGMKTDHTKSSLKDNEGNSASGYPTQEQVEELGKELCEYAALLEWRCRDKTR